MRGHGDGQPDRTDSFLFPAIGEADDEQACVLCGVNDTAITRWDQDRLGDNPDDLLNEQRGACQQPTGVAPPTGVVGFDAEEPESRVERRRKPCGQFDRRPVVFRATERRDDRADTALVGRRPAVRHHTAPGRAMSRAARRAQRPRQAVSPVLQRERGRRAVLLPAALLRLRLRQRTSYTRRPGTARLAPQEHSGAPPERQSMPRDRQVRPRVVRAGVLAAAGWTAALRAQAGHRGVVRRLRGRGSTAGFQIRFDRL